LYTNIEKQLLIVKPGITDFASIVFSDEGEILKDQVDPDIAYHQLIRPGKSALGLFYINNSFFWLDIMLCIITVITLFSRNFALKLINILLRSYSADEKLIVVALRNKTLKPSPPPGSESIVTSRN
ncbi:MAG: sugar transferase, partial [Proteobacteria bacterium]|nr:sugar transferase [Pseudomonadota bacterium]